MVSGDGAIIVDRVSIRHALRQTMLIRNRHACCVCQDGGVHIHHINDDPSDNRPENLAVLCLKHHDKATAPRGLTARLSPDDIRKYKLQWEDDCTRRVERLARGRSAFFMVDYKNAERIRQLYSQLTQQERLRAYAMLQGQFQEESRLRSAQGFDISTEPTTAWSPTIEGLLEELKTGRPHPRAFSKARGHAKDPLYPVASGQMPVYLHYDIWCQIMVRALIACRECFDLDDLLRLEYPKEAELNGRLVSFEAQLTGDVEPPDRWKDHPVSVTVLKRETELSIWRSKLRLKTHYVYSDTAISALSGGVENGLLMFRKVVDERVPEGGRRDVEFSCTPLIIGSGVLRIE